MGTISSNSVQRVIREVAFEDCPLEALGSRGPGQDECGPVMQEARFVAGKLHERWSHTTVRLGQIGESGEQPSWALQTVLEIHTR